MTIETKQRCAESVYKGEWSRRSQCEHSAGFGKDEVYCKQHSANHLDTTAPVITWYRVTNSEYSCSIKSVEVLQESGKYLIIKNGTDSTREAKTSNHENIVPTKAEAIQHCENKIAGLRARADKMEAELRSYR